MLVRFLIFLAIVLFIYILYTQVPKLIVKTFLCPKCDGKGHWYGVRHREECKACNGTGRIQRSKK